MDIILELPGAHNGYLEFHASRLIASFHHWTGRHLIEPNGSSLAQARELFHAPFVVVSHNCAKEPILNYGNQTALRLFELNWHELTQMPSKLTAEPIYREEREQLLAAVTHQGFTDNYRGVRVTKSGRRFSIEKAMVWNLLDENGAPYGQAATFSHWVYI